MSDPDYQHPAVLEELYVDRGMTQREIADKFGVDQKTISYWVNKHDLEKHSSRPDKSTLEEMYYEWGMTQEEISNEFDVTPPAVSNWMKDYNMEVNTRSQSVKVTMVNGYNTIRYNGHHIAVHRLVAVAKYGYDAVVKDDTHVHHEEDPKIENGFDNIELKEASEHASMHAKERYNSEDTRYREKSTLEFLHVNLGMSAKEIAERFSVTDSAIWYWLKKHDLFTPDDTTATQSDATTTQPDTVDEDPQYSLSEFTEPAAN